MRTLRQCKAPDLALSPSTMTAAAWATAMSRRSMMFSGLPCRNTNRVPSRLLSGMARLLVRRSRRDRAQGASAGHRQARAERARFDLGAHHEHMRVVTALLRSQRRPLMREILAAATPAYVRVCQRRQHRCSAG